MTGKKTKKSTNSGRAKKQRQVGPSKALHFRKKVRKVLRKKVAKKTIKKTTRAMPVIAPKRHIELFKPNQFEPDFHYYSKVLNAHIHPLVAHFYNLSSERLIKRYCYLHPKVKPGQLQEILNYRPKHFFWGGADLFYSTTESGNRRMVVIETNSCPSGQKSMPAYHDADEHRGYRRLLEESFLPALRGRRLPEGALAVIYDKNYMENSGYAATLSDLTGEEVFLIPHFDGEKQMISFDDGVMILKHPQRGRIPIRACLRYVTQKPWNRLPIQTKTFIYNSTLVCLAGGRNKLLASKAYEIFNSELSDTGLRILYPETIRDVGRDEIPLWVQRFGGKAVVKIPYSNAGQGVFTITNTRELDDFMSREYHYDQFIVQALIGHYAWSSHSSGGKYYHIGTVPNKTQKTYIADIRFMVYSTAQGFRPGILYARRARTPMTDKLSTTEPSWSVLGTNLSIKTGENAWDSDTSRLLLMDRKDFNALGLGIDDLIDGYLQAVLSMIAIDRMACLLMNKKGQFRLKLFQSLDRDPSLLKEILIK